MAELTVVQTREYIKHAIALETAVLTQEKIIDKYTSISNYNKPQLYVKEKPQDKSSISAPDYDIRMYFLLFLIIAVGLIFFVVGFFAEAGSPNPFVIVFGAVLAAIPTCIFIKLKVEEKKAYREYYRAKDTERKKYFEECNRIEKENNDAKAHYDKSYSEWASSNQNALSYLNQHLSSAKSTLQTFYQMDAIYPKYRNLPALTSIYEYLSSGRCNELTGPNGAYNLYESESRQDIIISQLNTIIQNLESIRQNQYLLYKELSNMNFTLSRVNSELSAIRGYTYTLTQLSTLNTFYNSVTATCNSALAFSMIIS